jgi:hypothetical protein
MQARKTFARSLVAKHKSYSTGLFGRKIVQINSDACFSQIDDVIKKDNTVLGLISPSLIMLDGFVVTD